MAKYLLAHDLGTSGNKAVLYSIEGDLIKSIVYSYDTHYFNNNWAEQDANAWWQAVANTTKKILEGIDPKDVEAVSFSGQMQGCVCIDSKGELLRPAIIWADQRAQKQTKKLTDQIQVSTFYKITGHRPSPAYSIEKLMWIKENEKEIYDKTYKMLLCKDYILFKLTGQFATDYSDASGTNAFDLNTMSWSDEILNVAEIDKDKLPIVLPSTHILGGVTHQAAAETGLLAGTPVVVGGGDGACATVGAGCIDEGDAYSCIGSSAWIALTSQKPIYDEEMRTFNFAHIVPNKIMPCGTMQAGGTSYSWLKRELAAYENYRAQDENKNTYELMNELANQSPAGARGLIYLPYLLGERSPRWNSDAKGAFIGLKMETKREDLFRSVLEGVCFNLNVILNCFKQHMDINQITVIGGGAKGALWRQIMADIYDMPVIKPNYLEEATSMGAAITAGVGAGIFKSFDKVHQFLKTEEITYPNEDNKKVYKKMYPIFNEAYESLTHVYNELAKL